MYPVRNLPSFKKGPSIGSRATSSPSQPVRNRPLPASSSRPLVQPGKAAGRNTHMFQSSASSSNDAPKRDTSASGASDRVSSGRIERRATSPKGKSKRSSKTRRSMPTGGESTEIAATYGISTGYLSSLISARTTEKATRDGVSRKAVKDELNAQRQANGVIDSAKIRGTRGEHCGHFLDPEARAAKTQRLRNAARTGLFGSSSDPRDRESLVGTGPNNSRPAHSLDREPGAQHSDFDTSLADYQGHEIYEVDEHDIYEGDSHVEDAADAEEHLETADSNEIEQDLEGGEISDPTTATRTVDYHSVDEWMDMLRREGYTDQMSMREWRQLWGVDH